MNEKKLHWIWEKQRFLSPNLILTNGEPLQIISPGKYNKDRSGPDFEFGQISIGGIDLYGPIEIHLKSSDWKKHGHQNDPAYQNVILHVVYEHDIEIEVNGYKLPTLVLKDITDESFRITEKSQVICHSSINNIDSVYLESMKSKALIEKLTSKIDRFNNGSYTSEEVFYFLLASAFGMKVNQKPFEELTLRVPWSEISPLSSTARFQLLLVRSGLIHENRKTVSIGGANWNYKGTRPGNYPSRRVGQFATLISNQIVETFVNERDENISRFRELIEKEKIEDGTPLFSASFTNHLIINAIVPYLFWLTYSQNKIDTIETILSDLAPEENVKINNWKKSGVLMKNALDSQSFLALDRYYCSRKKCLSCEVGMKVLNR